MHSIVDMGCCIVGQVYGIQNCITGHLLLEDLEFLCCILELLSDPATFWKRYYKHIEGVNGITSEALKDGFQQLLQPPVAPATTGAVISAAIQAQVASFPPTGIDCEQLNVDITLVEVQQAFKKLK
jgi:hypothetical protein